MVRAMGVAMERNSTRKGDGGEKGIRRSSGGARGRALSAWGAGSHLWGANRGGERGLAAAPHHPSRYGAEP